MVARQNAVKSPERQACLREHRSRDRMTGRVTVTAMTDMVRVLD